MSRPRAVVIGASAGGLEALSSVLGALPADFPVPVIVVQHQAPHARSQLGPILASRCRLRVSSADEKDVPQPGVIYLAPPNYHLLIELDGSLSLSVDERVNFSRPAIDVTFESAADCYGPDLIGVVLTGASSDGAAGLRKIKRAGGIAIVQDPRTAYASTMPEAAKAAAKPDIVAPLSEIGACLVRLCVDDQTTAAPRSKE